MGKRDNGKDKSPVKPNKGKGRATLKPADEALNSMLQDVAEELAATGGSPSISPVCDHDGASGAGGAGGAASGASASDASTNRLPVALLERRVEQRTKERDQVTKDRDIARAKAEALEKKIAELEAQAKVMLFSLKSISKQLN